VKRAVLTSILLAACLAGCGGEPASNGDGAPPVFQAQPSLTVTTASGNLTVNLWTSPSPPVKGVNALRFAFVDHQGAPVQAAGVTATAWMPAHGHGTSVTPSVNEVDVGVYEATRVVVFMDGRWEIRGQVTDDAEPQSETFVATFDVR
jgi:hypothetical protein